MRPRQTFYTISRVVCPAIKGRAGEDFFDTKGLNVNKIRKRNWLSLSLGEKMKKKLKKMSKKTESATGCRLALCTRCRCAAGPSIL